MIVKTVSIHLDRERHMRLTMGDAREFRRLTVTPDRPEGISLIRGDISSVALAEDEWLTLFWIMLRHEDPELTVETVGEIMDMRAFMLAGEAFEKLLTDFTATGEEPAAVDPTPSTPPAP